MILNETQLDIIKELVNIGVGRAAAMLNEMLNSSIKLNVPQINIISCNDLRNRFLEKSLTSLSSVDLEFEGELSGAIKFLIPNESASELVSLLTGEEIGSYELDAVSAGTLTEVGNIVLNSVLGSIGNIISTQFEFSLPTFQRNTIDELMCTKLKTDATYILLSQTHFNIENLSIKCDVIMLMSDSSFNYLKLALDNISK